MPISSTLAAAGVVLLLLAIVLREIRRARRRRRVARLLDAPLPSTRLAALTIVEQDGVAEHARALAGHVGHELHPEVLEAIVRTIRHARWQPIRSTTHAQLVWWADTQRGAPIR